MRAVIGGEPSSRRSSSSNRKLAEIGNIILNGCPATIANLLQRNLKMSLPEILRGEPSVSSASVHHRKRATS